MLEQQTIVICFSEDKFWQEKQGNLGVYQEHPNYAELDIIADSYNYFWSIAVKTQKQRKYRLQSIRAKSLTALIDNICHELNSGNDVKAITPDLIIEFYKD